MKRTHGDGQNRSYTLQILVVFTAALAVLSGCRGEGVQSMLDPAGPAAAEISKLWWFMLITGSIVLVITLGLLAAALLRRPRGEEAGPPLGSGRFVVLGGLIGPGIILVVLLILTLRTTISLRTPETTLTIQVIGHRWWWEVRYPEHDIVTANEIHIPNGVPIQLELISADVVHSIWIPRLHGKMDLMPDHATRLWIQSDEPGTYWAQCAEYCGIQHAFMRLSVTAHTEDAFAQWLEDAARPAGAPSTERQQQGLDVFLRACAHCHAISGTAARGRIGPDLTHLSQRLTIGAGRLPNNRGNLYGWISDPQPLKPGNLMPPSLLPSEELEAVVEYLMTLE